MIWGVLGDTGSGKTEYMAYLGWQALCAGSKVHSNFPLAYEHYPIKTIRDLKDIPLDGDRVILFDELHLTGDAYDSQSPMVRKMAAFIVMARKKDCDIIHSNQHESMVVKRVRVNTSMFLKPAIALSFDENKRVYTFESPHPSKGIVPFLMNVRFFDKYVNFINYEDTFVVYPAHLFYNTREEMDEIRMVDYKKISAKYENFVGTRRDLTACLERIDQLTHKDAEGFAGFLMSLKANAYLKELKNEGK